MDASDGEGVGLHMHGAPLAKVPEHQGCRIGDLGMSLSLRV